MDEVNELQASQQQKRMFFALCNQLGWDSEATKEKIKAKLKLDSFANISKEQLSAVIDRMNNKANNKTEDALVAFFEMHMNFKDEETMMAGWDNSEVKGDYSKENFPKYLMQELMKYFTVRQK